MLFLLVLTLINVLDVIKFKLMHTKNLSSTFLETDSNNYEGRVFKLRLTTPVRRNTEKRDAKYAVGMIVKHGNVCKGVIIAWHRYNNTPIVSDCDQYVLCAMQLKHYFFINCGLSMEINYVIVNENKTICYVHEGHIRKSCRQRSLIPK
ncbi:uncharacterized protein LOC114945463 isoform X2 [Nylanderia fulva]|uniref:uncharacterized protein LOC114945463 isoform X2 n=1 Tax=Nylanderia fulva TaxID=613905 RepID=UPI0010FAD5E1|nr:uncharacterized protein LOC114945463 isoform X2 [Nylanderia fulva]